MKIIGLSGEIKTKVLNSESFADAASDFKWIETNGQKVSLYGEQLVLKPYSLNFIEGFLIDQGFERSLME